MSDQIPTLGRIVLYAMTEQDAQRVNTKRDAAEAYIKAFKENPSRHGEMQHSGNKVRAGDVFPLVITRVWGTSAGSAVNGQLMLDGNDTLWVTSTSVQVDPEQPAGRFTWPTRVTVGAPNNPGYPVRPLVPNKVG